MQGDHIIDHMVTIEFSKDEGLTLLTCINYLFASIQDVDAVKDEQAKKDVELEYYRAVAMMQQIEDAHMKSLVQKLEELRLGLIKEGETEAQDIPVVEVVDDSAAEA